MVTRTAVASPPPEDDESYLEWLEASFSDQPSRKRIKRTYRRDQRIHVRSQRLVTPDASRISRALIQAQRQLAIAQAEAEARQQAEQGNGDGQP